MIEPMQPADASAIFAALAFGCAAGVALGWLFLAGLRFTVERLPAARRPALWLIGSVLVRMAIVLAGYLAIARLLGWPGLVGAVVGFVAVRTVLVRRARGAASPREPRP